MDRGTPVVVPGCRQAYDEFVAIDTLRRVVIAGLLAAALPAPALAGSGKAPLRVSVQVTRSCRVVAAGEAVSVGCGTRPHAVQVSRDGHTTSRTLTGPTPVAPASAGTVTIDF